MIVKILSTGILMAAAVLLCLAWATDKGYDIRTQQTIVFTLLCFVQLGNALAVRSAYHSLLSAKLFENATMWLAIGLTVLLQLLIVYVPFLQSIFKTKNLNWNVLAVIAAVTAMTLIGVELIKFVTNKKFVNKLRVI